MRLKEVTRKTVRKMWKGRNSAEEGQKCQVLGEPENVIFFYGKPNMVKLACSIEDDQHYFTGVLNGAGGHSTKEKFGRDSDIEGATLAGKDEESEGFLGREEGRRDGGAR